MNEYDALCGDNYADEPEKQKVWCSICGAGWVSEGVFSTLPDVEGASPWRCHSCFLQVAGNCLHCPQCGGTAGNHSAHLCRTAYAAAGLSCACISCSQASPADGLADVRHVVLAYILFLLPILIGSAIGGFQDDYIPVSSSNTIAVALYAIGLAFTAWNWKLVVPLLRLPQKHRLAAIIVPVLAAPVTVGMAYLQLFVFPFLADYWENYSDVYYLEGYTLADIVLWNVVCPAVFEELMFRGVILQRLRQIMTPWQAIMVTAMFFGILHLTAIGLVFYLVPMAVVAGWLTVRTKSLLPAITIHFLHNCTIIILEHLGY